LSEIAGKLNISKSSASLWCREIELEKEELSILRSKERKGSLKGGRATRNKYLKRKYKEKTEFKKRGIEEIGKMSQDNLFICGLAIYWSEGYTYESPAHVAVVNMDPYLIKLMMRWFREICGVKEKDFKVRIRLGKCKKNNQEKIENFWSRITKIPLEQFDETNFYSGGGKDKKEDYFGVLRVRVLDARKLKRKIEGWIEGLKRNAILENKPV